MARPPAWRHTLDEARRQALVAIDFYNRPGDRRSFSDFIVHIHLAWQNLLHADRMRRKAEIFYRESGGRRPFKRNPDRSRISSWVTIVALREFARESGYLPSENSAVARPNDAARLL